MKRFEQVYLTHRGLFNNIDIPENSLSAFKKTVENNYGTELDIQMTKDGQLVVFHDSNLKRMCGINKLLTDCTYRELQELNLLDTNEKIPLFKDVLEVLKKDTPLIVEMKDDGNYIKATDKTIELLEKYDRTYTMESFNPLIVRHLKKNYPHIIRGQLTENYFKTPNLKMNPLFRFIGTYYLLNFLTRPDYVAHDVKDYHSNLSFLLISKVFKGECVAWTIKTQTQLDKAKNYYSQFIFDSFIPK